MTNDPEGANEARYAEPDYDESLIVVPAGIPFTQFMMPDGRRNPVWIERSAPIEEKAREIIAAGYRFECEMLSDFWTISLTIADPAREEDLAIELCANGPAVPDAVDRLIEKFTIPSTRQAT